MSPTLQLLVELVEHEVAEQGRKWPSLGSALCARTDQPIFHHPGLQEGPNELQQPLVADSFSDPAHQFVMIDSIEEFLQIEINAPAVTFGDIPLCLRHCLMSRPPWSEPVAMFGKCPVPLPL